MKEEYTKTKLGVTVFSALVILFITILWGKNIRLTGAAYRMNAVFSDVTGLENGARVLINGIPKGKVGDYSLGEDGVIVVLKLDDDVVIYDDAYAWLETPDLMGEKVVSVFPGKSGVKMNEDGFIPGMPNVTFGQMFSAVGEIKDKLLVSLETLNSAANSIRAFVENAGVGNDLDTVMDNLVQTSAKLNLLAGENSAKINGITDNLLSVSGNAAELMDSHKTAIDTIIFDLSEFSSELQKITLIADKLTEIVTTEESTLGKLLHNGELYFELKRLTQNIDSLVTQIRTNGIDTHLKLF